jgi:signal transduction histidine kinase
MGEILRRSEMLMKPHAAAQGVHLETSCSGDDRLECDAGQIQQVLVTLMNNSIEALAGREPAATPGRLEVSVHRPDAASLAVVVEDNGPGMSEDVKSRIFEPFFTTKSNGKGVGLGLSIAYGIIEHHHGSIEVDTAPGRGARFTVTLPTCNGGGRAAPADAGAGV